MAKGSSGLLKTWFKFLDLLLTGIFYNTKTSSEILVFPIFLLLLELGILISFTKMFNKVSDLELMQIKWYPSRPGFYYFGFNNGSHKSCNQDSQKLFIKVSPQAPPPLPASQFPPTPTPIPPPISGGEVSSSPAYPWPFHPREAASSPAPEPSSGTSSPLTVPTVVPDKGGGIPFINSNPAVPLPTGEVDSATIRPLPASGHHHQVPLLPCTHIFHFLFLQKFS